MTREEVIAILRSPEGREETRSIYRLRMASDMVAQLIAEGQVSRIQAEELVDGLEKMALNYFPESGDTFKIVYGKRFQRLINEAFGPSAA